MKFKTTNRELKNKVASRYLFKTGYCNLQHLLHFTSPIAYASGVYGWNYDVYKIDDVYITTGYRSMVGQPIDYKLIEKYDNAAREIVDSWTGNVDAKKEQLNELIKQFINELFN